MSDSTIASFKKEAATEDNPKWLDFIKREDGLYEREDDTRSEFSRDYNRILHCTAYRRLKHKTQVFFASENDHVCTRIEHVNYVAAISNTISKKFELNTELTSAIAIGHDLGHAPFGHEGEKVLDEIANVRHIDDGFWHEKNSLWFVDNLETLSGPDNKQRNLSLTYAVRDGIVCHCGERDEESTRPRSDAIDLQKILRSNHIQPFTWEGCVVKIADKIAYLGKDIEDAFRLKIITQRKFFWESRKLKPYYIAKNNESFNLRHLNNSALIHCFVLDLLHSSNPEIGMQFSKNRLTLMEELKKLNGELIYNHRRLENYKKFAKLVLESIFNELCLCYDGSNTLNKLERELEPYKLLKNGFLDWMIKYTDIDLEKRRAGKEYQNKVIYTMDNEQAYFKAVIGYISGMTDNFALVVFNELISFR